MTHEVDFREGVARAPQWVNLSERQQVIAVGRLLLRRCDGAQRVPADAVPTDAQHAILAGDFNSGSCCD